MGTLLAHLDGVTVRRGTREVLRGIDLDLPTGTVLALLGPSGAGKSTLLALLAGQVSPADGEVRWTTPDPRVGLVTQAPHLFPWLTVTENIAIGPANPMNGRMNSGARNGPITVPRPKAPARLDMAVVRSAGGVCSAT